MSNNIVSINLGSVGASITNVSISGCTGNGTGCVALSGHQNDPVSSFPKEITISDVYSYLRIGAIGTCEGTAIQNISIGQILPTPTHTPPPPTPTATPPTPTATSPTPTATSTTLFRIDWALYRYAGARLLIKNSLNEEILNETATNAATRTGTIYVPSAKLPYTVTVYWNSGSGNVIHYSICDIGNGGTYLESSGSIDVINESESTIVSPTPNYVLVNVVGQNQQAIACAGGGGNNGGGGGGQVSNTWGCVGGQCTQGVGNYATYNDCCNACPGCSSGGAGGNNNGNPLN